MKGAGRGAGHAAVWALAAVLVWLAAAGGAAEDAPIYRENQWNYVEDSMDVSAGIPADVTGRLADIRSAGRLTVATEPYYPPQEFIDETKTGQDRYVGADMELARLIAERMGVELEIVPLPFIDVIDSVAEGRYDLAISALSFTMGRAARLEMSKGYYYTDEEAACGLIIREEDRESIQSLHDLAERDIVAQSGSIQETMASENIVFYRKFRRLSSVGDVYQAVETKQADAGAVEIENARSYIQENPACGLMLLPDVAFALQPQYKGDRIAAEKGEIELICFVNGVIDEVIASGQYDRWFEQYARYEAGSD